MEGARIVLAGEYEKMQQTFRFQAMGMAGAVLLIYFLLVALFRSYVTPLVVLSAVPIGIIGVVLVLFVTGTALNVQSLLGVIFMIGIVVSNTVLLIDLARDCTLLMRDFDVDLAFFAAFFAVLAAAFLALVAVFFAVRATFFAAFLVALVAFFAAFFAALAGFFTAFFAAFFFAFFAIGNMVNLFRVIVARSVRGT